MILLNDHRKLDDLSPLHVIEPTMQPTISPIFLRDGSSGSLVPARLFDCITDQHLQDYDREWRPFILSDAEHQHWDWRTKMTFYSRQSGYHSFGIECADMTQGLMLVNPHVQCKIPFQFDYQLVYVEYLEAAPWNRGHHQRFKGVGTVLIAAAIQLSLDLGQQGRIGLHSLPQADSFYRDRCQMTDLGPDLMYPDFPLSYFEMTDEQATRFLNRGGATS